MDIKKTTPFFFKAISFFNVLILRMEIPEY